MTQSVEDAALREEVERVLVLEVAPLLGMDGAGIEVVGISGGVVQVRLNGACSGCPGSIYSVIMGIEEELRRRVSGVEYLEAVP